MPRTCPAENRAKSFGKIGAAFGFGFICGPMLGGLLGNVSCTCPSTWPARCRPRTSCTAIAVPESLPRERRASRSAGNASTPSPPCCGWRAGADIRGLVVCYTLLTFAQMMLQSTWVLYTTFRFGWTPRENGIALFCVGVCSIVVQAGLLALLIRRFGEMRLSLLGLASGAVTYLLYGLATQGWMMYVFILCNLLAFAAGPALQGILSKSTGRRANRAS
jgi:DHA1 family tetracycline resistance protein-like MFS transporter